MLEVDALERVARIPQREIERQPVRGRRQHGHGQRLRQYAIHVLERDLIGKRGQRQCLNRALQLREVPRPVIVSQRIQCGGA